MPKTNSAIETPLRAQLDRLTAFEPTEWPVLSLYLNLQPDQHGRDHYDSFLRKTMAERVKTFKGSARASFTRDVERINLFLGNADPSLNGLAIFACAGANDFFETIQLDVPLEDHWLFIGSVPHLYPLAKIKDQYPRYAALLVDTNSARLFVFSLGTTESTEVVQNVKTRKTSMGGWSQARYQRHRENFHLHHMKEVVDVLDRAVREESLTQIVVACDDTAKPLLMEQLPRHLADKIVDTIKLDINAPQHEVFGETLEALRNADLRSDAEHVEAMMNAWRARGLAVVGPEATLTALRMGQVEELLITSIPARLRATTQLPGAAPGPVEVDTSAAGADTPPDRLKLADELVKQAHQTGARIRFVEDEELLLPVGGCGALLRFKV
jgi:peptide subunit release factor 1 (eRF1)